MKIKTSELSGAALDWAVAKCEELPNTHIVNKPGKVCVYGEVAGFDFPYQPSTDWSQGGPIIDREDIDMWKDAPGDFAASIGVVVRGIHGPTKLIAAMRCFVASKLGDEVDVPEELYQ